ncbi:MAG: PAS domain-containing protein, partial [Myxococcaceae bacterium]
MPELPGLAAVIDSIQAGFVVLDREFRVVLANQYLRDWVKRPAEELCGQTCYRLFHESGAPCSDCPCEVTFRTGAPARTTHSGRAKDGSLTYAEISSYPVKNARS